MDQMVAELSHEIFVVTVGCTCCTAVLYFLNFIYQKKKMHLAARMLFVCTALLQTLYIGMRYIQLGHTPITSPHETLFFFVWALTWASFSFRLRYSVKNFGTFSTLLILIFTLFSAGVSRTVLPLDPVLKSWWLPIHVGFAIFAFGFFGLAFVGGLMYLLQEWELKSKRFGYFFSRLPSLDALDKLNGHCLTVGLILLTLGMVSGLLWNRQIYGLFWQWTPKEVWTLVTWCLYLVQFHQRFTVGWQGRRAALMAVFCFIAVLVTLLGVAFLLGGAQSYAG